MLIQALVAASLCVPGQAGRIETLGPDAEIGSWLVDLARHQGHLVGRSTPRSASLRVLSLLKAAADVCPDCPDAYYWLYDLEQRMGRRDPARQALSSYVRLMPADEAARIRLFEIELEDRQTAEARADFVKEQLKRKGLPRSYQSELHRWLARHYYERRENGFASREVEHALRLNPSNLPARELAYEMFGETEPALQRVELALQLISINPSQVNLVWDLGEFLDRLSLHVRAQEWYNRAIELHGRSNSAPVPVAFRHKLAVSFASSGDYKRAVAAADEALLVNPEQHTTRLLRAHALRKLNRTRDADADIDYVAKSYLARIDEVTRSEAFDEAAEIAWFYCYHQPTAEPALKLARLAMKDPQPSSLAKLALGYALRLNGKTDEAIRVLKPLAEVDQLAAYELARARLGQGEKAAAMTVLHRAAGIQHSGIGFDLIRDLLDRHGEVPPRTPLNSKVIAALDKFKRDVFDYHRRPQDFLKFTLQFVDNPLPPVGPVRMRFRVENAGDFPVTFGEGLMARPLVAISARLIGTTSTNFDNYLQVLMTSRPALLPGDAIEKTVSIDVGAVRTRLIETAAVPMRIEVTAMFDPVYEQGRLTAGLGTVTAGPISVSRSAIDVSPSGITTLVDRAESPDVRQRMMAADQIGALLAGVRAGAGGQGTVPIPMDSLNAALSKLLSDHAWQVRAHAVVAAGWSPLNDRVTVAAAPCVRKEEPIVKLLAVRLFAEQHGEKFRQVLEQLSKSDASPFVRRMASSYLPVTTQAKADAMGEP